MPYSGDPSASPVDAVRYELQDVGNPPLLTDAEIQYEINRQAPLDGANPLLVAAFCADVIAGRYAGEVNITADGVNYSGDQLQQKYVTLASNLRARYDYVRGLSGGPISGGTARGGAQVVGARPTTFAIGMDDNLRAGFQRGRESDPLDYDDHPGDI